MMDKKTELFCIVAGCIVSNIIVRYITKRNNERIMKEQRDIVEQSMRDFARRMDDLNNP